MINIIGSFFGCSGYDIHCKELANSLSKFTEVKVTTNLPVNWEAQVTDKELEMIQKPDDYKINMIITNPIFWRINCTAKRNWVFLIWEGDKIPDSFIEECENPNIEYIFVPSQHTFQAVLNTISNNAAITEAPKWLEKVKIMPHGVDTNKFYPRKKKQERFTFMANKGFRNLFDRGGIQYLIQAYMEEFTNEDNTLLLLKINPAYGISKIDEMISEIALTTKKTMYPMIQYKTEVLPYNLLVDLYKECDVFVSPTRAEAFNLGCIEAMACGKPVITTNFGGQTDFVNNENGWLIGGTMNEVKNELMYESVSWLTPDIKELRNALRMAYNKREELLVKGERALETAREYSWDNTSKKIASLLK